MKIHVPPYKDKFWCKKKNRPWLVIFKAYLFTLLNNLKNLEIRLKCLTFFPKYLRKTENACQPVQCLRTVQNVCDHWQMPEHWQHCQKMKRHVQRQVLVHKKKSSLVSDTSQDTFPIWDFFGWLNLYFHVYWITCLKINIVLPSLRWTGAHVKPLNGKFRIAAVCRTLSKPYHNVYLLIQ